MFEIPVRSKQGFSPVTQQKGATLVVALVILVVMSLVGLASMSSSTLQARMAFNKQQKILSMMAADAVLRTAEKFILTNIRRNQDMSQFTGGDGLFTAATFKNIPASTTSAEEQFTNGEVDKPSHWLDSNSAEVTTFDSSVSIKKGRYFIEYMGRYDENPSNVIDTSEEEDDRRPYMFRLVAIGWGQDPNIYTVLQSTFKTGTDVAY